MRRTCYAWTVTACRSSVTSRAAGDARVAEACAPRWPTVGHGSFPGERRSGRGCSKVAARVELVSRTCGTSGIAAQVPGSRTGEGVFAGA